MDALKKKEQKNRRKEKERKWWAYAPFYFWTLLLSCVSYPAHSISPFRCGGYDVHEHSLAHSTYAVTSRWTIIALLSPFVVGQLDRRSGYVYCGDGVYTLDSANGREGCVLKHGSTLQSLSRVVSVDSVHLFQTPFFSFPFAFCLLRLLC